MQNNLPDLWSNENLRNVMLKLPHKILHNREVSGLAQIILHELGPHLGFKRAMYLIDNPDFSCLKGVAGFCQNECKYHQQDLWQNPHAFGVDMEQAAFHDQIQKFYHDNVVRKDGTCCPEALAELGKKVGLTNPHVFTWPMRHDNTGILLYDPEEAGVCKNHPEVLDHASALLGLCSV
ncbi:hypothetical protein IPF37_00300 [bacterium]|nr:MAG: hypothetical protein IPF37_00300 [bacterium]